MSTKIESKFGKYAIPNLTNYIICFIVVGFFINVADVNIYQTFLSLDFTKILNGEVWRLLSYLLFNSNSFDIWGMIFFVFSILFYSFIGKGLESIWGKFWYNVYVFGGLFFNFIGSFIIYLITGQTISQGFYPILNTMFLAFAFIFPEFKINFYMVIPIKIKWLGIIYGIIDVIEIVLYFIEGGVIGIGLGIQGILSLLNFVLLFLLTKNRQKNLTSIFNKIINTQSVNININNNVNNNMNNISNKEDNIRDSKTVKKMDDDAKQIKKSYHKCCVCGKTELDDSSLEFRYCSKCEGEYEYCSEHLKTHIHIKPKGEV